MPTRAILGLLFLAVLLVARLPTRAATEAALVHLLQSDAGIIQKADACQQLRRCGSARSVPALARLLGDRQLSQAARHALEGITAPEASDALREALGRTSGRLQAGVADSLGWKRDSRAVPLLIPLLHTGDPAVACAAASALGRIGVSEALASLDAARCTAPATVRPAVVAALLDGGARLLSDGEKAQARRIYESLFVASESVAVRVAAYAGRIRAADTNALALIKAGIEGTDGAAQVAALQLAGSVTDGDAARLYAALLPSASTAVQIALLAVLRERGDASVLPAVLQQARNPDAAVRTAALFALGALGDASAVPVLAQAATASDPAEQNAAREALLALRQPGAGVEMVVQMRQATPAVRMELARALAARGERSAIPALVEMARSEDATICRAALLALKGLVDGSDTPALVPLLAAAKGAEGKDEVVRMFETLAGVSGVSQHPAVDPLVRGWDSGDLETRQALLSVFALFAHEALRSPFRAALQDPDARIRTAAARALCDAQDAALLPDLMTVARQAQDARLRALALEGVVRLATDENAGLAAAQRVGALTASFELASRVEEKRRVISGVARVPDPASLKLAERAAADDAVRAEAELACLQIARKLGAEHVEGVKAVLARLANSASSADVRKEAQALLQKLNPGGQAASPSRQATVPADGRISLVDYDLREWGPELVHYNLDTNVFTAGKLALLNREGKAVPFQLEGDTLAFVARLARGQSVSYTLQRSPSDRSAENTTLKIAATDSGTEIANEFLALRLPPSGSHLFAAPVEADRVTPPLQEWKPVGADWMGGSRFATQRKFASQAFKLTRQGPACAEFEARYTFAPKGEYLLRIRLSPGMPLAVVTEEFDMGEMTAGGDFLLLELGKGWQPTNIAGVLYVTEQAPCKTTPSVLQQLVAQKTSAKSPPVGGAGAEPVLPLPASGLVKLFQLGAGAQTQGNSGGVQLWDGEPAKPGAGRNIAMVSLHSGSWRRTMTCPVWHQEEAGVLVGMPISVRPIRWCFDVADDSSPFSTHEHDESLPRTYGRREWGLYTGTEFETAQPRFGHIGLDRYKDWIVDYPEGPAATGAYPGSFFSKEHVARLRNTLDQSPAAADLKNRYLMSGKTEDAVRNARSVIAKLKSGDPPYYVERDFWLWGQSNYRKSQLLVFVSEAEDALACPELPSDLRQELRRWLTLYAYVTSDSDWNPRGAGVHHGNNNMPINRTLALAYFAGLLPNHPCYDYWMNCVKTIAEFKLASQFSPHGESIECPEYSIYAPAGVLNIVQNILRHRGLADLTSNGVTRRNLEYMANLTMADPRFGGARIIPGMGNSANTRNGTWGASVATFVDQDPAFAGWCKAMFQVSKGDFTFAVNSFYGHPMYYLPDVLGYPAEFKTVFMPAYGVAFRAHGGTADETAMLLRAGPNSGHWDPDPLNVILYGQGAPLSPGTGYQYYSGVGNKSGAVYHNRVRVGKHASGELFGRVDVTVADYGFGPSADYAMADRYLPPQYFGDDQEGSWRRHVLFLKSDRPAGPSYFVMRDTFPGAEHRNKWWTWLNLDLPDKVRVDGTPFPGDKVPVEKAIEERDMPVRRGQTVEMAAGFGASSWFWFTEPRDVRVRAVMQYNAREIGKETKTIVEALAGAGQDYFYVVFPKKDGEPVPSCAKVADGVLKIVTSEATNYAFVSDAPLKFGQADVTFEGRAGAVRVFEDRVVLCMNSGSGRIGYRGMIFEGPGPFEKVVALNELKPAITRIEGGYEKKNVSVDIGRGITVRGEGPFEARLDGQIIRIKATGRARMLHVTQPPFIIRPQYWIDGQECMASWTDYPSSGWGTWKSTWLMALAVPEGEHELVIKDYVFPPVWARPFTPLLGGGSGR